MANFRRRRPRRDKGETWARKPELDSPPDPPCNMKKKKSKPRRDWVVTGKDINIFRKKDNGRVVYGRYETEKQAEQAMRAMKNQDRSYQNIFFKDRWPDRNYRVEYQGKDKENE